MNSTDIAIAYEKSYAGTSADLASAEGFEERAHTVSRGNPGVTGPERRKSAVYRFFFDADRKTRSKHADQRRFEPKGADERKRKARAVARASRRNNRS